MSEVKLINTNEFSGNEHITFKIHEDHINDLVEQLIRDHKGLSDEDDVKKVFVTREMGSDQFLVNIELEAGITD